MDKNPERNNQRKNEWKNCRLYGQTLITHKEFNYVNLIFVYLLII